MYRYGVCVGAVGWGTALQPGRSRVRFPMVSLEFFIDIFLLVALWPWGVIGLLTGHNTLRRHLHVMGLNDNPTCRKCGTEKETSAHILCECEALASPRHTYLGSFFWTRRTLGFWGWGPSGTLLKEQDSYNLVQNWGHRGPVLRPRCIGPGKGPYPIYHSILFYDPGVNSASNRNEYQEYFLGGVKAAGA